METSGRHLDYLDGWRGLAILLVLEAHFVGLGIADAGRLGVDLFFVLSGRLMAEILFLRHTPLSMFYKRRASRVLPAFLVFIFVVFAIAWWRTGQIPAKEFLATLLFLRTYVGDVPIWESAVPIQHLWSLNVEEHSYVALSVVAVLARPAHRVFWLALGCLGCVAATTLYVRGGSSSPGDFALRTECAALGLLSSAAMYTYARQTAMRVPAWITPLALGVGAACYTSIAPWYAKMVLAPPLLAISISFLDNSFAALKTALSSRLLVSAGTWSFSIYLWQQPLYRISDSIPKALALTVAVAAGLLSYYFIEMPARSWLNRRWSARTAP
jgi:peptidoglycan/LPS O-acetylase OafA/YrhL